MAPLCSCGAILPFLIGMVFGSCPLWCLVVCWTKYTWCSIDCIMLAFLQKTTFVVTTVHNTVATRPFLSVMCCNIIMALSRNCSLRTSNCFKLGGKDFFYLERNKEDCTLVPTPMVKGCMDPLLHLWILQYILQARSHGGRAGQTTPFRPGPLFKVYVFLSVNKLRVSLSCSSISRIRPSSLAVQPCKIRQAMT